MYIVLADYGFMCRFASSKSFKNILEAKQHMVELKESRKSDYKIKYFVIHESEIRNEVY